VVRAIAAQYGVAGQIAGHSFGAKSGGRPELRQTNQLAVSIAHLFLKFAPNGLIGVLAGVDFAGRNFDQQLACRHSILLHQHPFPFRSQYRGTHGMGMMDHFALSLAAVGQFYIEDVKL